MRGKWEGAWALTGLVFLDQISGQRRGMRGLARAVALGQLLRCICRKLKMLDFTLWMFVGVASIVVSALATRLPLLISQPIISHFLSSIHFFPLSLPLPSRTHTPLSNLTTTFPLTSHNHSFLFHFLNRPPYHYLSERSPFLRPRRLGRCIDSLHLMLDT